MERVLQEKLHSPAARGFQYVIGAKGLQDALRSYEAAPKYQRLVIPFEKGEDPDDAYSEVPYEKGANFLLYLGQYLYAVYKWRWLIACIERMLGGLDVFLPYIYDYVNTFTGKSITASAWSTLPVFSKIGLQNFMRPFTTPVPSAPVTHSSASGVYFFAADEEWSCRATS